MESDTVGSRVSPRREPNDDEPSQLDRATISSVVNNAISSAEYSPSREGASSTSLTGQPNKKRRIDVTELPTGLYLQRTVVPLLRMALVNVDRIRPENPVEYLANFLSSHKKMFSRHQSLD